MNPTNIMGTTKYLCEQVLQGLRRGVGLNSPPCASGMSWVQRLGDPTFKKQIAYGGPVTITDRRIIRYFMTIPEAVQLVLEAGSFCPQSGEVYVLTWGRPVHILSWRKILSVCRATPLCGYQDRGGRLRPGEKPL